MKNMVILFTNTDSLTYEIETNDVYKDFFKTKKRLILANIHKIQNFKTKQTKNKRLN